MIETATIHPRSWLPVSPKNTFAGGKFNNKNDEIEPKNIDDSI